MANRTSTKRPERKAILIVCEGENTEPAYFKAIKEALKLGPTVDIQIQDADKNTSPEGIIKVAQKLAKQRAKEAEQNLTKSKYDSVWVVFDAERRRDDELQSAILTARKAKVIPIISRPCFEAWYLHHEKRNLPSMASGKDAEQQLIRVIPAYGKSRDAARISAEWALKEKRLAAALRHARAVEAEIFTMAAFPELPISSGTAVHCLVAALIDNCTDRPALDRLGLA